MKRKAKITKLEMLPVEGRINDINLYISSENDLYPNPHTHDFFEFCFIHKGKLNQTVDNTKRILSENDVCVLRPEALHNVKKYENHPCILYNFEVNIQYLNELCKSLGYNSADDIFKAVENYTRCSASEISELIKIITTPNILTHRERFQIEQSSLKIVVSKILMRFILNPSHDLIHKKEDSLISTMLSLLEDKNNFNKSIKELCEQSFYTQEHITRLFRKANLNSPNRIHLQKKLQYAANLLLNSDMKIIEVSEACGIETVSYFTKSFKREYGFAPSTYRKMYRY